MGEQGLSAIRSTLTNQIALIDGLLTRVLERAARIESGDPGHVESTAFQVNNYYSVVEDLLRIVAAAFENNIPDVSRWHSELIDRMALDIPGVRPPLLSTTTAARLHRLRSFRHFFRHAYRVDLDAGEVMDNVERVRDVHPHLVADLDRFLLQLGEG
ncbi:MAG TPA: hypothetical protein PLH39_11820 [Promineifilum sp.]|nr:hypothetical protein [Promineifilum sp.]